MTKNEGGNIIIIKQMENLICEYSYIERQASNYKSRLSEKNIFGINIIHTFFSGYTVLSHS